MLYLEILYPKQQTFPGLPAGVRCGGVGAALCAVTGMGGITFIRIAD